MAGTETVQAGARPHRAKTPTVIQMEAVECGAASLGIVLSYYGRYVPLAELRERCGVSRDGSNALYVLKAARSYGLEATGYRKTPEQLREMPGPLIVFWQKAHFLVVEGFADDTVYLNDPATGPRTMFWQEFQQGFSEVALAMKPGPQFEKGGKPLSVLKAVFKRVRGVERALLYTFLAGALMVIPAVAVPAFTQVFVDNILVGGHLSWKWGLLTAMAVTAVASGLLNGLQGHVFNRLGSKLSMRFATGFFWHILQLPMTFYSQRYGGEIAHRISLTDNLAQTLTGTLATTFINCLLFVVYGALMLYYDPIITGFAVLAMVGNIITIALMQRTRLDAYARYQQDCGKSVAYSIGGLQNIETVKATATENKFFSRWAGYYTKTLNAQQQIGKVDAIVGVVPSLMNSLATMALLTFGVWRVINGHLTVGMLMAIQILMRNFMEPIAALVSLQQTIQLLKVDIYRLDDVLTHDIDPLLTLHRKEVEEGGDVGRLQGYVELRDLTFGYNSNIPPIVEGIDLQLSPGKSVALVGPSGSGKSTVAKIIAGLYQPWSGEVLFDGHKRDHYIRERINSSLAIIEQEAFLFTGTIRENLTLMDPAVPEADIVCAARDACIHEDIIGRKGGYHMQLVERGENLSGGQRQRMEIARSLMRNPSILIMDEATSALDSGTEAEVIKNIRRRGCATLVIAHRLSTIRNCDEILVMKGGRVIQKGTHDELKAMPGLYRDLIESEVSDNA